VGDRQSGGVKTLALLALVALSPLAVLANDTRVFEMRTYTAAPGRLDALHARFREHTLRLFAKHGIESLGYWVPVENTAGQLIFVLSYASREAREAAWKKFLDDPDWKAAQAASEKDGKLVKKVEQRFMVATDFSPEIKPAAAAAPRIFELRTYLCTPGNLPALDARFRDHTMNLFARHGMVNLFYWHLMDDQPAAKDTLVYLLAHASTEAAKASFDAFRKDPEWLAARQASEQKAGGSLTVAEGGVKSLFLQATDYSPTK
jgi:hypothetical protein